MPTRAEIEAVYAEGVNAMVAFVQAMAAAYEARLVALEQRLATLERRLAADSHNSHRPPSADPSRTGRPPVSRRTPSGKRSGGQPGHPGTALALRATPEVTLVHQPAQCATCGHPIPAVAAPVLTRERRQVLDLPPARLVCTEHRVATACCAHCGTPTTAAFPADVPSPVQYGPGVGALGVLLTTQQHLPLARAADLLGTLCGQRVSPATILRAEAHTAAAVQPVVDAITCALIDAPVVHADETGFFVSTGRGAMTRVWLHTVCTPTLTRYHVDAYRGQAAHAHLGILPARTDVVVHDCYHSLLHAAAYPHALCGAHLDRELIAATEDGRPRAGAIRAELHRAHALARRARAAGRAALDPRTVRRLTARWTHAVRAALAAEPPPVRRGARGCPAQTPARALFARLQRHTAAALRFVTDLRVPFDNSEAERALRMMKLEQKISGGFRTVTGAERFCTLRSYVQTARQQGVAVLDALRDALSGHPFLPALG